MPPKKHPHESESIYNSTSEVRHGMYSLHVEQSYITLSFVHSSVNYRLKIISFSSVTHSSCLLYRRKLRSSLHRRHLKHASPWFPHMRAIHNKDPRYPCLILLHAVRVRFIEEKHLNGTYSSFKIFWAGICDENLIEIIITFFFVAKQQFNYDKMLFFYLEMNWEMYLFITAGQERDQRLVWMFKSASHPLDSLVYLDL